MMEHKAFLFDHNTFERELRKILEKALVFGDCSEVVTFINSHLEDLRDPYEGMPLNTAWESLVETPDAHQYGDFALTKYYDPLADVGLDTRWECVEELIAKHLTLDESPILGSTIGPKVNAFDPGKMGAYFQSVQQVQKNQGYLLEVAKTIHTPELDAAIGMLSKAVNEQKGLFVTF